MEKKPIYKKWWFWVIVVIVIGAIGSSMGDEEAEKVDKQAETKEADNKETEAETEALYTIGDSFEAGKLGVKVLDVEEKTEFESDNQFIDNVTTEGKFIAVTAELTNNDTEARTFSSMQFKVIDDQDREFDAYTDTSLMMILGDKDMFLESCNPGMSRTGVFVFEVPANIETYYLEVDGGIGFASGDAQIVKLK